MKRTGSRSDAQQFAEQLMVGEFSRQIGRELAKQTIPIGEAEVSIDGFHKHGDRVTVVEVWAHVGRAKGSQPKKILADILKLALVKTRL